MESSFLPLYSPPKENLSPATPLLREHASSCCSYKKINDISRKIWTYMAIPTTVGASCLLGYITYGCIKDLTENPIDDSKSITSLSILAVETLILGTASWFAYRVYKARSHLLERYPHHENYQGNIFTPIDYEIRQNFTKDFKITKPLVESCLKNLEQRGLLEPWLEIKNYHDKSEAIDKLLIGMTKGLCYGHTFALLMLMPGHFDKKCSELTDELKFENIFYYQFWINVIVNFINHPEKLMVLLAKLNIPTPLKFYSYNYIFLYVVDNLLKEYNFHVIFHQNQYIQSSNHPLTKEVLKAEYSHFQNSLLCTDLAKQLDNFTIAGTLILQTNIQKEEKDQNAHALFFQLTDHIRFHDSGSLLTGFFEFPNKDAFFDGLAKHIQTWPDYKDGILKFAFYLLPKATKKLQYEEIV